VITNWQSFQARAKVDGNPAILFAYAEWVHKCCVNVKEVLTIQLFRLANANATSDLSGPAGKSLASTRIDDNPVDPTNRFTKQFKRLVNFLNLRNNMRPCWHCGVSEVGFWLPAEMRRPWGKFK